jgi:hypothetical protein
VVILECVVSPQGPDERGDDGDRQLHAARLGEELRDGRGPITDEILDVPMRY